MTAQLNKNTQLLKISLVLLAVISIGYGIIYLLFPQVEVNASGAEPIPLGWIRWFGGILIPIGIAAIMAFRNPEKQGIFVTMLTYGNLLVGLALLYSVIFEPEGIGNMLNTVIPAVIHLLLFTLFWISLKQAKAILW